MKAEHTITWFEIPATDFKRAVTFYNTILDTRLKVEKFGPDAVDLGVFPADADGSAGCVIHAPDYRPHADGVVIYLNCQPSLDKVLGRIEKAGGAICTPKTALPPGMGYYAHIRDSEGNRVGLHALS